jgi:hypothetical protein
MDYRAMDYRAMAEAARKRAAEKRPVVRMEQMRQLKLYEHRSVLPNLAARSTLFTPVKRGRRRFAKEWEQVDLLTISGTPDPAMAGVEISYQYEQLSQLDLNIWLMLISFDQRRGGDGVAAFTRAEALRWLKKSDGSRNYRLLDKYLDRLGGTRVQIRVQGQDEDGKTETIHLKSSLVTCEYTHETKQLHVVELSKALKGFFAVDDWTLVNTGQRLELGSNEMALAVHTFLSANKAPAKGLWITWEQAYGLWGQGWSDQKSFRKDFRRRVLKPLIQVGFLTRVDEPRRGVPRLGLWWQR